MACMPLAVTTVNPAKTHLEMRKVPFKGRVIGEKTGLFPDNEEEIRQEETVTFSTGITQILQHKSGARLR